MPTSPPMRCARLVVCCVGPWLVSTYCKASRSAWGAGLGACTSALPRRVQVVVLVGPETALHARLVCWYQLAPVLQDISALQVARTSPWRHTTRTPLRTPNSSLSWQIIGILAGGRQPACFACFVRSLGCHPQIQPPSGTHSSPPCLLTGDWHPGGRLGPCVADAHRGASLPGAGAGHR